MNWHLLLGLALVLGTATCIFMLGRETGRTSLARLADPAPLPGEPPLAGCVSYSTGPPWHGAATPGLELAGSYGPFPVDTAPLLFLSEALAAYEAHEREIRAMCDAADQRVRRLR